MILGSAKSEDPGLISREIYVRSIPTSVITISQRHGQTDRQADRQTERRLVVAILRSRSIAR